jgi:hypothetical protein
MVGGDFAAVIDMDTLYRNIMVENIYI